ncbi:MAG: hypothetical protein WCK65_07300 [Rhodospirillaceae bacterium]
MRRVLFIALVALIGVLPVTLPVNAYAQTKGQSQIEKSDHRLLAVGAGAIVGVVIFNMLTTPYGSVPFVAEALAPTPTNIARGSRVLATLTGGAGALAAHYIYSAFNK